MNNVFSTESVLKELAFITGNYTDITEFFDEANDLLFSLNEEQYEKVTRHLRLDILDVERFVKVNNCQVITNPRAFAKDNIPSDDGLLSNKIFGITKEERAGIFAYIDLHGWFMDPSCYKSWTKIDKNIKNIVHGIDTYSINEKGLLVQDPAGKTGIDFLRKNINRIKFVTNESLKRDINVKYLEKNRDKMFIQKYLVIPPFYRDKNTSTSNRTIGLSGVNKLYNDLIIASNALTATQDYMFDATNSMNGRVQEIILNIYNWFCGVSSSTTSEVNSRGIQGKFGILRRANMSKTANYSSRLVISAPELKVEKPEYMKVNINQSAIPLAACMATFRDFIIFHTRKFFDNEFTGVQTYPIINDKGEVEYAELDSPEIFFSDDRIIKEMEKFLHGYNNRFIPVEIPIKNVKKTYYMQFKGRYADKTPNPNPESIYQRPLTWCDIFFISAMEAVKGKHVLITRFPIDSYTNQITTEVTVSCTKETEPMIINDIFYEYYPKIRKEDIGIDTSNKFIDSMNFSNVYLKGMGGDYDGDQITVKGVYTEEANEELRQFMNSKQNFITFGGKPSKASEGDAVQSIYAFTKVLSDTKLTQNIQFT